jgi:hypothetical protein
LVARTGTGVIPRDHAASIARLRRKSCRASAVKTSYFANRRAVDDPHAVAISRGVPRWFKGRVYDPLRPSWKLLQEAKQGTIRHDDYERRYRAEVLAPLDPAVVRRELGDDAILLCWERPDASCHRRIVARWLEEALGLAVPELE